ncbi:MAG TPA: anti-sigma factor [Dehalococcoidia bacterium]|nr:anti-sigma factor [Dehalococcoidia bacterium]
MTCEEFRENVEALALGALSPEETAAAEQHVAGCAACARELRLARAVVERLPLSAPARRAPAALRDRVLAAVGAEAAGVDAAGFARRPGPAAETAGSASQSPAPANNVREFAPPRTAAPSGSPPAAEHGRAPVPISRWRRVLAGGPRLPALAAAALLLALVGLAAWSLSLQGQLSDVKHQQALARSQPQGFLPVSQTALTLLASQGTVTSELDPAQNATATGGVIWNPEKKQCVVLVQHLPPAAAGQQYHIWFTSGDNKWDGGALTPDGSGSAFRAIDMTRWNVGAGYHLSVVLQATPDNGQRQPVLGGDLHASLQ